MLNRINIRFIRILTACGYLIILLLLWDLAPSWNRMFYGADAREYLLTGSEFWKPAESGFSFTRPFLFSTLTAMLHAAGGAMLIWIFQLLCWLVSAELVFRILEKRCRLRWIAWIGWGLFLSNLSLIIGTYHALTEVFTAFLLSALAYVWLCAVSEWKRMYGSLLLLVLLVLTKPVFVYPFVAFLFFFAGYYGYRHLKKRERFDRRRVMLTAVILLPILLQTGMMKWKYDRWMISGIGDLTLRHYLVAQRFERTFDVPRDTAIYMTDTMSAAALHNELRSNISAYSELILANVKSNANNYSVFLEMEKRSGVAVKSGAYMSKWNKFSYLAMLFFFAVTPLLIIVGVFRRVKLTWDIFFVFSGIAYLYAVSGISFYQGDRLVLFILPLSIVLPGLLAELTMAVFFRRWSQDISE